MAQTIDFQEVKRFLKNKENPESRFEAKMREFQAKGGLERKKEDKEYLFFYSVFTSVVKGEHKTLSENEVRNSLKQYPNMEVYYCRMEGSPDNPPAVLKGRRIAKEIVPNHEQLSDLIYLKTGCKVKETDLMLPQKDSRPLNIRAMAFMRDSEARKEHQTNVERIYNCLVNYANDAKKRKECLSNCKTK